ncbi:endothelin-converting enzyme-like 1 [Drosophila takahashii]|uniref:endothelin-converting enzyme-like 1 n=1 Tax=Drosophila takahashii TaxID=29030 RepID=UPI001CF86302|nr:endothelin-converting enzyme-like 1 [Drosophila takahashii]
MHFELHRSLAIFLGFFLNKSLVKSDPQQLDPCTNFYKAACGNWSTIHAGDPYQNYLDQLDYNYHEKLAALLEIEKKDEDEPGFQQLLRDYYTSCRQPLTKDMALRTLERLIYIPILGYEELIVGLIAAFRYQPLVEIKSSSDMFLFWMLLITREDEWNANETNRELMSRQDFDLLWEDMPKMRHIQLNKESIWTEVSGLERQMQSYWDTNDKNDVQAPPTFWMLPWPQEPYYASVIYLANLLAHTSHRVLLIYIYLRLKMIQGPRTTDSSWLIMQRVECAEQCRQFLTHPAVWLIERNHPRLKEESVLQGIFNELKQRFGQKLRANRNNFSRQTQQFLLSKLERMTLRLSVLPRKCSNETLERRINRHYRDVRLNSSDYFGNLWTGLKHSSVQKRRVNRLLLVTHLPSKHSLLPVIAHQFGTYASPFYIVNHNMLIVPLSLLGPPLYIPDQKQILTYSSLGFILGHELTHGFDPEAVIFNSRGTISSTMSRQLKRNPRFQQELSCLNQKFGGNKRDEKFADLNGLELAYSAYFDTAQTDGQRDRNGSGSIAQRQQFFLNFAQFFCSSSDLGEDSREHGSDRQRVNDAVLNFEPFLEAFGCPSSHNPKKQCRLF